MDNKSKIIRDIVHGYISVNTDELKIIDHPLFQRLKWIRQGCNYAVYPSTNHTRFEHSLGVMHLGKIVFKNILKNLTSSKGIKKELEKKERAVGFACLLHDIGQAPFSHIGESFYDRNALIDNIVKLIPGRNSNDYEDTKPHELMSALIILKNSEIKGILEKDIELNINDISFMADMICGVYQPYLKTPPLAALIQILYSSIDVDRLDFVLRDNKMTGGGLFSLDAERTLMSFVYDSKSKMLCTNYQSLSTIINLIYGRSMIYMWIINHHRNVLTSNFLTEFIKTLLKIEEESGHSLSTTKAKPSKFQQFFSYEGIIDYLVDDSDVINVLKENKLYSDITQLYYEHIFARGSNKSCFLYPVWKSGIEFNKFLRQAKNKEKVGMFKKCLTPDTSEGNLSKVEEFINNQIGCKISEREPFFVFKCKNKYYEPYKPSSGKSNRDAIYLMLRDGEIVPLEEIYNISFSKEAKKNDDKDKDNNSNLTADIFPFFYLKKNSPYIEKIKKIFN